MKRENLNSGWKFYRNQSCCEELTSASFVAVNLPHTWNNLDGQDGGADYFRGTCVYVKSIDLNKQDDKDYYIEFLGVNAICHVYVNNVLVGSHEGGFSTFRFCVTNFVQKGINTISVVVDNSDNDRIYPKMADFTFFGGIYRDVFFIEVNKSRFDLDYFGGDGVMVTPILSDDNKRAEVTIESFLTNAQSGQMLDMDITLNGNIVESRKVSIGTPKATFTIENPRLWDGVKSPILYRANVRLLQDDKVIDERNIDFGIRRFSVDKDGFYLNGRKYRLHGVSRHQDRLDKGYAICKCDHDEDMALIKEIGATTIRLAHYQHDQYFYDLCDRNGMVVWAEIPYISVHLAKGDDNAISQMKELVIQNYNHPSIMFIGLSNEITIGGESKEQLELHKRLNKLVHELDKTRLTVMANVSMCDTESPLLKVPDIFSYNHYFGWYVGDVMDNAKWLDDFREKYPTTPIGISEYGCEAVIGLHSSSPKQGDYSEEYQAYYHENMLKIFEDRPYLWSTHVWNMFDFAADARDEGGTKGRNNKGLVSYDRKTKKDTFYLYKAYWSDEPFVHICSKGYSKRVESVTTVKVYSNQGKVDLYIGDNLVESKEGKKVFEFVVPLQLTGTKVKVVANGAVDTAKFRRVLKPCMDYVLKESKGVDNWFEIDGEKYEFKYPEGKYSIRDTIGDIMKNAEGKALMEDLIAKAYGNMAGNGGNSEKVMDGVIKMVSNMTLERVAKMAQDKMDITTLYHVNERLNKIDK